MPKQGMIDSYALMANRLRTESQAKCFNDKRDCHLWSVVTLKLGETNFFLAAIHTYVPQVPEKCSTTYSTMKLLLRIILRIFPLEDLSFWGSWETFLLRIFPLEDLDDLEYFSSWGSWEIFLMRCFPFEDLEDLSFWGFIFRASSVQKTA